ncbi:helix-turn-helix transcriptional regulator [Candidatus Palauibacter sp.]|uniref:helix-turn-helix transcriptional regulator n=1 Tax=Candidatus Palauibacter sp. TaxID=3101350 RepID=UPI003B51EC4C
MTVQDRFERALLSLYEAALADDPWVSAATLVNDLIRTRGHGLVHADPGPGFEPEVLMARFFTGTERREDYEQVYVGHYLRRDEAIPRLYGLRDGELAYKSELYTEEEKKKSSVYNEFRSANKGQNGLFVVLHEPDGRAVVWSLLDSLDLGGWGHDQIRTIKRLAPHIRQFARVRHAMANAKALGASLTELLDNGRSGFIQLNRRGRILEANDRALDILLKRDGLRDDEDVLAAGIPEENAELRRLLAQALSPLGAQGAGGSMKITRLKAPTPLVIEIHPVRGLGTDYRALEVGALVLVTDPAARPRIDPALPTAVLGLSPAESRMAVAAALGQTVPGMARELGCAESTVRTHLKRVYRKQGLRNRAELVRRILSLEGLRRPIR